LTVVSDRGAPRASFDAIYLSPHADDAAFSCGAQIHARTARGERVLVVTVFSGAAPPTERLSSFAAHLHEHWRLGGADVAAARRAEDERAMRELGAALAHVDLPDAIYRADASGRPLYPAFAALFGPQRAADSEVLAAIERAVGDLPESPFVAAPLAVGAHVDHRLVHDAARRAVAAEALWLYEDYPYAESWRALRRATSSRRGWDTRVEEVGDDDLAAKVRAIARYESQLGEAFRAAALERRVRKFAARRGGERLWRPPAGEPVTPARWRGARESAADRRAGR
jgi:LmbE family N-acetylglucosaminyl deacetylase